MIKEIAFTAYPSNNVECHARVVRKDARASSSAAHTKRTASRNINEAQRRRRIL